MGKQLIEGGMADCVMALGFEKMERGSLKAKVSIKDKGIWFTSFKWLPSN